MVGRKSTRLALLLFATLVSNGVHAECINPLITPTECDFKDEDTQLWGIQEGEMQKGKHSLFRQATKEKIRADNWEDDLGSAGPTAAQIVHAGILSVENTRTRVASLALAANTAMSDPYRLRFLMAPQFHAWCMALWKEPCMGPVAPILAIDALRESKKEIDRLLINPMLTIGETWGNWQDDISYLRAEYNSLRTFAYNNTPQAIEARLSQEFKTYQEQLTAAPQYNRAQREAEVSNASTTLTSTIRDTMKAARQQVDRMTQSVAGSPSDLADLAQIRSRLPHQVGRRQILEQTNMLKAQAVEGWSSIGEVYLQQNSLFALNMAEEGRDERVKEASKTWFYSQLPTTGTIINDGIGFQ